MSTVLTARAGAAWRAAHEPVAGVPRWARTAALAIPFLVLPSSLWRIVGVTLHVPIVNGADEAGADGNLPSWLPGEVYVVLLSLLSEGLAFTAVGLVCTWGEVFPRWVPFLRGRRVPTLGAVIPAALGAAILTPLWGTLAVFVPWEKTVQGRPVEGSDPMDLGTWEGVLAYGAYLPLVLWGPLLAAVTVAYWRRRRAAG
ncbi:hypothetical protein [Actinomadura litoris]|uniref:Uncharacterized protein n=1 Tax=Actinomadura litoris TaxID=2678616 RepID=A0A7K1KWP5_9ACTN|nr:hypothetical protein [Actinomadura litoris]MUN36483.1 hypothetical protein [Actinomadura litoris]